MNLFKTFKKILRVSFIVIMISLITSPYLLAKNNESKTNPVADEKISNESAIDTSLFTLFVNNNKLEIIPAADKKINNESAIDTSLFTLEYRKSITNKNSSDISPETLQIKQNVHQYYQKRLKLEKIENSFFTASLVSLLVLNVADYISTKKALKYEGISEGNPFLKPIAKNDLAFFAVKAGLTVGNHFLMKKLYKTNKPLAWVISIAGNFFMSYVVANNFNLIQNMNGR